METIVVYSVRQSNRLKFVLDWLLKERLHLSYRVTSNKEEVEGLPFFIAYGAHLPGSVSVPDMGLLWENGVQNCAVTTGEWKETPTLFSVADESIYTLPFDIFSGIFFLLSRHAVNSILYKNGWLQRPIADEWITEFRKELELASGNHIPSTHFAFQPTYDIDMAYSHLHKGLARIAGAYIRAIMKMDVGQINERTQVLKNKQKDPYDSFRWLRLLHKEYDSKPLYFILAAFKTTSFDKNIHPGHPAMLRVIKNIARDGVIGIHPSYYSDEHDMAGKEKKMLEHVAGNKISISRQHYIRVRTPSTFRLLLENGITDDYSMGYGSHLGFRAGTGNPFYWYDLEQEKITTLRIHPFCFMDTTAHFEARLSASEAMEQLEAMSRILEKTGSTLVTIFHNFSLGTASEWKGWRNAYEHFVGETSKKHALQTMNS
jgi:hypothetical protein